VGDSKSVGLLLKSETVLMVAVEALGVITTHLVEFQHLFVE